MYSRLFQKVSLKKNIFLQNKKKSIENQMITHVSPAFKTAKIAKIHNNVPNVILITFSIKPKHVIYKSQFL